MNSNKLERRSLFQRGRWILLTLFLAWYVLSLVLILISQQGYLFPQLWAWVQLLLFTLIVSAVTWLAYWRDKRQAEKEGWRIKESTLHLLSVAGGWPGAWCARILLRHKTLKLRFRLIFWVITFVQISILCGLIYLSWNKG